MSPHLVTFALSGKVIAEYRFTADGEADALVRADCFYRDFPMFSMFEDDPDLTIDVTALTNA